MPAELKTAGEGRMTLSGSLDFDSVPRLYRELLPHLEKEKTLSVNMKRVGHCNSAGLALLLQWIEDAGKQRTKLTFLNMPTAFSELADLHNLTALFEEK